MAKKIKAKRKLRRPPLPHKKLLISVLLITIFAGIFYFGYQNREIITKNMQNFVAKSINAKLEKILVEGVKYTSSEDLNNAINMKKGDTLVGVDVAEIRKSIEDLSWVKLAIVSRELPSTLKIEIYEHHPFTKIIIDDELFVINKKGEVITRSDSRFDSLPTIKGENSAIHAGELFMLLSQEVKLLDKLVTATYIGERRWDLVFSSGVQVQLPEENSQHALKILVELNKKRKILEKTHGTVDLRISDRVILRDIK